MSTDAAPLEAATITKDDTLLTEATPHQRNLTWELNGASWAGPMSLDEYIGREQALSETALSANGGIRYFILHHKSDPSLILSACEVLTKRALVAHPGKVITTVPSYGLASVFTPPRFRGQGLASHMLRLVQSAVDTSLSAEFGVLYSDIGRSFYTHLGWPSFPSPQLTMQIETGHDNTSAAQDAPVTLLTDDDVPELCARDCAQLQSRLERLARDGEGGKKYVAFLPDYAQMSWHFARASYVARVMRDGREVKTRGARTTVGDSWLYWDHDLRENKLKVLRVVKGEKDGAAEVKGLLQAALKEAQEWGLPKVLVWAPGEETSLAATELWREGGDKLALVFDEREDGSIPSLRWKGGEDVGNVLWEANEYYAWC
ncbi:hypothetical protein B0T14DRAFT_451571 [Immersiella caudata]|uniref:LYC1 C-terminal domain-containing protein n=1 Tax=Immersiella caudata TaxID=314043 RepID=A0AA39WWD3_9PEZI|nr:hypothetical protein B0T14DRAFT_451571 [Immersiella caudata]